MSRNPEQYPLVELRGMQFFAYHGCYEQERKVGNRFLVELKMRAEESQALVSDDISDALNYAQAYQVVAREMAVACSKPYSNRAIRQFPATTQGEHYDREAESPLGWKCLQLCGYAGAGKGRGCRVKCHAR